MSSYTGNGKQSKRIFSGILLFIAIIAFLSASWNLPYLDSKANQYFSSVSKKAVVAYAICRGINAGVSAIQHSEIGIAPAGVGVQIAFGQVLDPLNDMVERVSSVLVWIIVAAGVQQIAMEVGNPLYMYCIALLSLFLLLSLWLPSPRVAQWASGVKRLLLILFVLRLFLPISALVNDLLYNHYWQPKIEVQKEKLQVLSIGEHAIFPNIDSSQIQEPSKSWFSWWEKLKQTSSHLEENIQNTKDAFARITENLDTLILSLTNLIVLYISHFLLQVILLPLASLWTGYRLLIRLFGKIQHPSA